MEQKLYERISAWMEEHREELIRDIMRLVRIPSVSDPVSGTRPFGAPCREAMDEMLKIAEEHGFVTENYDYYVGSIGTGEKNWENMIGFWNHLDVVPAGNGWKYEPFHPVQKGDFLIGRGAQDNKGPAVGMLYVMQCLRELGVPLAHELCLFVGCDEEHGMEDLAWYRANYPCPAMSMIADSGFPVCYGEKGILEGRLAGRSEWSGAVLSCTGGSAGNIIPDLARAVLRKDGLVRAELLERLAGEEGKKGGKSAEGKEEEAEGVLWMEETAEGLVVSARGRAKHSAFPEGSRNAVHMLTSFLGSLNSLNGADRKLFQSLALFSEGYYGTNFGAGYEDEVSGKTTCAATVLSMEDRRPILQLNIRYAITDDPERLKNAIRRTCGDRGFVWEAQRNSAPGHFPGNHPAVGILTDLYNEITGEQKESFVMGGGTYARMLPNAFAYGPGGLPENERDRQQREKLFCPGCGGAHEPDEGLNVRQLLEALKIYALGIVALNGCSLKMEEEE